MNQRETIEGITGEWRTVTKASEVTVGQRVRYEAPNGKKFGYSDCEVKSDRERFVGDNKTVMSLEWGEVQAFFPLPAKPKRNECISCKETTRVIRDNGLCCVCDAKKWTEENIVKTVKADKQKRKVAKVVIRECMGEEWQSACRINGFDCYRHYGSYESALRGARRFCKAIGYECEVVK